MAIRKEVRAFIELGPLPRTIPLSDDLTEEAIDRFQTFLAGIQRPVTDDEARALVASFGPDDCFGLAWALLHLIETSPAALNRTLIDAMPANENEWARRLWDRAHRG